MQSILIQFTEGEEHLVEKLKSIARNNGVDLQRQAKNLIKNHIRHYLTTKP